MHRSLVEREDFSHLGACSPADARAVAKSNSLIRTYYAQRGPAPFPRSDVSGVEISRNTISKQLTELLGRPVESRYSRDSCIQEHDEPPSAPGSSFLHAINVDDNDEGDSLSPATRSAHRRSPSPDFHVLEHTRTPAVSPSTGRPRPRSGAPNSGSASTVPQRPSRVKTKPLDVIDMSALNDSDWDDMSVYQDDLDEDSHEQEARPSTRHPVYSNLDVAGAQYGSVPPDEDEIDKIFSAMDAIDSCSDLDEDTLDESVPFPLQEALRKVYGALDLQQDTSEEAAVEEEPHDSYPVVPFDDIFDDAVTQASLTHEDEIRLLQVQEKERRRLYARLEAPNLQHREDEDIGVVLPRYSTDPLVGLTVVDFGAYEKPHYACVTFLSGIA